MADSTIAITAGSGTAIDTRTEGTNGNHRQVIVIGDPATNAGVAPVDVTAGLKVDLGADNDITGTVTANLSATDNAVLDAIAADTGTIAGDTTSIDGKLPALGQALAAASIPVILPSATITTLTPPAAITGFATSAKQDTIIGHVDGVETLLGTIDADTSALAGAVAGTEVQVDVLTSALPSGASTAAKQPALGTAGTASTDVITVQGITSMTALKVDGSAVTQPVSGTVTANLSATDNAVLDDIAADTEAIKTSLAGTITVTGGGGGTEYTEDAAAAANPVGTVLQLIREDARAGSLTTTDGDNVALRGNNKGEAYFIDTDANAKLTTITGHVDGIEALIGTTNSTLTTIDGRVDGVEALLTTIDADTSNLSVVGGGTEASALRVTIANNSTGVLSIDDNGAAITVDGTVTADLGATDNAVLDAIAASTAAIETAVEGTLTVTGGGGGVEYTEGDTDATIVGSAIMWEDTRDTLRAVSAAKPLPISDAGGTLTVDGTVAVTNAGITTIAGAVSGTEMQVDVLTMPTVAVTQSGTWDEVGINDSGNSITVDYATTGSGTATGALRVELPTNGTGVIATVGAVTAITNALPAGTNAIGKLAANSGVDIGDVTLTAGTAAIGTLLPPDIDVTAHTNYAKKYYTNAGAATDGIIWSPAAGKRWHVINLFINVSAAATVTLEDDKAGGDEVVMKMELAANSGIMIPFGEKYPLASGEDAADLLITTSAGNVYVTATGYEV